jgi:signal transduction histidine kinase/DNA-binding response OmpR family regulator/HAMP domain-containing protein
MRLLLIVGTTMLAFALVIFAGQSTNRRQSRDLTELESRLVPRLEVGPRLEAEFERLRQSFKDAVAAQDPEALEAAAAHKQKLYDGITAAGRAIDPAEAAHLRRAIESYYALAYDVSKRLIGGESGEALPDAIAEMQTMQEQVSAVLQRATRLDRRQLAEGFAVVSRANDHGRRLQLAIGFAALGVVIVLSLWSSRSMLRGLARLSRGFERFGAGDFSQPIPVNSRDELGSVAADANQMAESLRRHGEERDRSEWIKAGQVSLSEELRGEPTQAEACARALTFLVQRVGAMAGALYLRGEDGVLRLASHYGLTLESEARPRESFRIGEGLVGRAATKPELLVIDEPPQDYLRIRSGLGEGSARSLVFLTLSRLEKVVGVVELALFVPCSAAKQEFLNAVRDSIAVTLEVASSRAALRELLEETRQQAERLTIQEEELRENNQELQVQQEGLREANTELEAQRQALKQRNTELEQVRGAIQQKAEELAKVSAYKSQFLANMSHELRTPLNSMLLLSNLLWRNETATLTEKQVEYASTIHSAGKDLLGLINQLLDLAKIEAGREELQIESVPLETLAAHVRRVFAALAADKGLTLVVETEAGLPASIATDRQRLERILINLVGNALKFTERGEVALRILRPPLDVRFKKPDLVRDKCIAFAVSDTGIGIASEAQERVFAPFEQIDSRSDRRYGGTGLGLAIARESAQLLGGELQLESVPDKGSTFTVYVPEEGRQMAAMAQDGARAQSDHAARAVPDDRASLTPLQAHLLVIEDDAIFAEQLVDIIHGRRLKALVAKTGEEGIQLARQHRPQGIILDVRLPDIDGWTVMERLREDPATKDIAVHFMSAIDAPERAFALGAAGYTTKPAALDDLANVVEALAPSSVQSGRILVIEDSSSDAESILQLLRAATIEARHVTSAAHAIDALKAERFRVVILDLGLPGMDGVGLLEALKSQDAAEVPPVIVYTGRQLSKEETRRIEPFAAAVILKDGHSEHRLLDEVRLFVQHVGDALPKNERPAAKQRTPDVSLSGKRILVADDDMRTVYAVSALLRGKGAEVLTADTGRDALKVLDRNPDVDGILMDIMMPEMDGYEAMRQLRQQPRFAALPVIALTAKAMADEEQRCLGAGATQYLAKPVDSELLLASLQRCLNAPIKQ